MDVSASWLKKLKLALKLSIAISFVYSILSYFYVDNMIATGVDPVGEESQWDISMVLSYTVVSLLALPVVIFLFVSSIGFMFRTAQWLKSMDASAIEGKPGMIIAAYFIPIANLIFPWRYMLSMNKAGVSSDEQKKKLKTLIHLNLALGAIAIIVGGNQWAEVILGSQELTFDEVVVQEWRGILGTIFDMGAMVAFYFIVTPLYEGLAKRSQ